MSGDTEDYVIELADALDRLIIACDNIPVKDYQSPRLDDALKFAKEALEQFDKAEGFSV